MHWYISVVFFGAWFGCFVLDCYKWHLQDIPIGFVRLCLQEIQWSSLFLACFLFVWMWFRNLTAIIVKVANLIGLAICFVQFFPSMIKRWFAKLSLSVLHMKERTLYFIQGSGHALKMIPSLYVRVCMSWHILVCFGDPFLVLHLITPYVQTILHKTLELELNISYGF